MEKKKQLLLILEVVERDGEISRNKAISMYISRLAQRIADLEALGFRFAAQREKNDYVYKLVGSPQPQKWLRVTRQKLVEAKYPG